MDVWNLLQDEILGMKWLNRLLGEGLSRLGLDITGRLGGSVQFFLYVLPHTKVIKGREYCMYFPLL